MCNFNKMIHHAITAVVILTAGTAGAGTLSLSVLGGGYSVPVVSMQEARFKSTLRQQYDFSCGSAAIASLLTYQYGYAVSEAAVFQEMFAHGDQVKIKQEGFSLLDMKRFLEARGFVADGFVQTLEKLSEAKLPAIVLINDKGYHHFVVIKGLRDERVLIGDPSGGTRAIARSKFESMWVNRLLFVIHNKPQLARFNHPADWNAAPQAYMADAIKRGGLDAITLPKHGPGDF